MQDSSGKLLNDMFVVDSSTGSTVSMSRDLPVGPELSLTYGEWDQAWRRLLDLISEFLPDELDTWKTHHNNIAERPNRSNLWPVYLKYDARIRCSALSSGVDPTYFQYEPWNELDIQARQQAPGHPFHTGSERFLQGFRWQNLLLRIQWPWLRAWELLHLRTAPPSEFRPIVTPLLPDWIEADLVRTNLIHIYHDIPIGLREGFDMGINTIITKTYTPPNHHSSVTTPT
ncbi:hypothetical protein C8F01DRAFT_1241971 [Mycena amicta]|nr:hypothetical protein C8F01DRAFT_1241971 [Mycena amicta]